ncbi:hypothetical protein AB0J35_20755 [Nonomuraea angiospora]|uniref:hypothetical protein n=1 Tax=Nonomuraea angiospora TaxID=46172 RepID=UPI003429D0B2
MGLADEVGRIDAEVLQPPADVGMTAARPLDAEMAEHIGDAAGAGRRLCEQLVGILDISCHGASLENAADIFDGLK